MLGAVQNSDYYLVGLIPFAICERWCEQMLMPATRTEVIMLVFSLHSIHFKGIKRLTITTALLTFVVIRAVLI